MIPVCSPSRAVFLAGAGVVVTAPLALLGYADRGPVSHAWAVFVHAAGPVVLWMLVTGFVFGGVALARWLAVRGEPCTGGRSSSRGAGGAVTGERARGGDAVP